MKSWHPTISMGIDGKGGQVITNEQFLSSFVRFGVWLRHSLAFDQIRILMNSDDPFIRVAATANFYSAFGALVEDTSATLLAVSGAQTA